MLQMPGFPLHVWTLPRYVDGKEDLVCTVMCITNTITESDPVVVAWINRQGEADNLRILAN